MGSHQNWNLEAHLGCPQDQPRRPFLSMDFRLSCSSRRQPQPTTQLPAVCSHIDPWGEIRAKWLLQRGEGFGFHGWSQQHPWLFHIILPILRHLSAPNPCACSGITGLGGDLGGPPTCSPPACQLFLCAGLAGRPVCPVTPWEGHKYCYLHLIMWCQRKAERICSTANDSGFKPSDLEVI